MKNKKEEPFDTKVYFIEDQKVTREEYIKNQVDPENTPLIDIYLPCTENSNSCEMVNEFLKQEKPLIELEYELLEAEEKVLKLKKQILSKKLKNG